MFALRVPDVGDGLAAQFGSKSTDGPFRAVAQLDCGSQQHSDHAFRYMSETSPEHFILSHFHWDHYNGLGVALRDPTYEHHATRFREVYFPRFPDFATSPPFVNRTELARTFLALSAFVMGRETGVAEADLLRVFRRLNDRPFSYQTLAKGDYLSLDGFTIDILWPPRTIDAEQTISAIRTAIATFHEAMKEDTTLRRLYDEVGDVTHRILHPEPRSLERDEEARISERSPRRANADETRRRDATKGSEQAEGLPPVVEEALRVQRVAANHLGLSFRIGDQVLSLGDLEAPEIHAVATDLISTGTTYFEHVLTAHHGTHWHQDCRQISARWAISSVGARLIRYLKPYYKEMAAAHWVTHLMGGWESAGGNEMIAVRHVPAWGTFASGGSSSVEEERFAEFFAERNDVLYAVEAEAKSIPGPLAATVASLVLRLDVSSWTPLISAARARETERDDFGHGSGLRRLITKLDQYERAVPEARAFVAACRDPATSAERLASLLSAYEASSGSKADIRAELMASREPAFPILCREFRRMYLADPESTGNRDVDHYGEAEEHYGYSGAWYVQLELADLISQTGDYRALAFLAEALLKSRHRLSNHNSWAIGMVKCVASFKVSNRCLNECMSNLTGINATEILRPVVRCHNCGWPTP